MTTVGGTNNSLPNQGNNQAKSNQNSSSSDMGSLEDLVFGAISQANDTLKDLQNKTDSTDNNKSAYSFDPTGSLSGIVSNGLKNAEEISKQAKDNPSTSKTDLDALNAKLDDVNSLIAQLDKIKKQA